MHEAKDLVAWANWKNRVVRLYPGDAEVFWLILRARTAMGYGLLEEQLLRLMVWVGATMHHGKQHNKLRKPLEMLRTREGWCDQQSKLFCFLAYYFLGIKGRTVSVKNGPPADPEAKRAGHTMAELFYDDVWHLFDVHKDHQTVYRDSMGAIQSMARLRAYPELVGVQPHWWKTAEGYTKEGFYRSEVEPVYTELDYADDCAWPWAVPPP